MIAERMLGIIAHLRALNLAYHHAHINAKGPTFYGDHLLLQRLYFGEGEDDAGSPILEIDAFMERLKGLFPEQPLHPYATAEATASLLKPLANTHTVEQGWQYLLHLENQLLEALAETTRAVEEKVAEERSARGDGLLDLLQGTANTHQGNVYLLQQRLAGSPAVSGWTSRPVNRVPITNPVNWSGWAGVWQRERPWMGTQPCTHSCPAVP